MAADAHLVLPAFFGLAFADSAVDEPAEFACLELPGRAVFTATGWAFFDDPAGLWFFVFGADSGQEKEDLPFDMGGDRPPSLLITVNCFDRNSNEFGQLFLGFV